MTTSVYSSYIHICTRTWVYSVGGKHTNHEHTHTHTHTVMLHTVTLWKGNVITQASPRSGGGTEGGRREDSDTVCLVSGTRGSRRCHHSSTLGSPHMRTTAALSCSSQEDFFHTHTHTLSLSLSSFSQCQCVWSSFSATQMSIHSCLHRG